MVDSSLSVGFVSDVFEFELVKSDNLSYLHIAFHSDLRATSFTKSIFSADHDGEKFVRWQISSRMA